MTAAVVHSVAGAVLLVGVMFIAGGIGAAAVIFAPAVLRERRGRKSYAARQAAGVAAVVAVAGEQAEARALEAECVTAQFGVVRTTMPFPVPITYNTHGVRA